MYFCRHCLSLFLSTIQWVWLLDFVSYKIHIFICSRIFKLIFVFQQNLHVESSRVPTFYTWSSYQPNNDLSCICCCFTKNGNKSWSTKQKQKNMRIHLEVLFWKSSGITRCKQKRVQCARLYLICDQYIKMYSFRYKDKFVRVKNCWSFTNDSKVVFVA